MDKNALYTLQALAADTCEILKNPQGQQHLITLAEAAHLAEPRETVIDPDDIEYLAQSSSFKPAGKPESAHHDEQIVPLLNRKISRKEEELCAAWCVALACYYYKDCDWCPELFPGRDRLRDRASVSEAHLRVHVELCIDELIGNTNGLPDERIPELTYAARTVLRGRVDEWQKLYAGSALVVPVNTNDVNHVALGAVVAGGLAGVLQAAVGARSVDRVTAIIRERVAADSGLRSQTADHWAAELQVTKKTVTDSDGWREIMKWRAANRAGRVSKKTGK